MTTSHGEGLEQRVHRLRQLVCRISGAADDAVQVVRSPLRICPLGAHIDHQGGRVTGMALDRCILLAFCATDEPKVVVESLDLGGRVAFDLDAVPQQRLGDWGDYLRGAVRVMQQNGIKRGLFGVVAGDMPIGGLSSSAAVTTAYLLALQAANGLELETRQNMELVRRVENEYVGLRAGILDQSVILNARRDHLVHIDCRTFEVETVAAAATCPPLEFLVAYSGLSQGLVGTGYNARVEECHEAARRLLALDGAEPPSEPLLGDVPRELFVAEGHRLPGHLRRRASHFSGEMARVADGLAAWRAGDLRRFGELVTASGESSIVNYECGCPQLISLYELLRQAEGVYGTRFSGAGFRGSCLALVDPAASEAVCAEVSAGYKRAHPEQALSFSLHRCTSADGARLLNGAAS